MSNPPTGTVTFLFTDIEGSTAHALANLAAWEAVRARHHAIVQTAIEAQGGVIFQVIGDAFCAAFANAPAAAEAAVSAQRALQAEPWKETPVRVRMGIHTGAAEARDGEYHGYLSLVQVQRVMALAHGGQILVSQTTADLLRGQLAQGISLRALGPHHLRGLPQPESIWQLAAPDLPSEFPPLRSAVTIPNNLPLQLSSFVGRERERDELRHLLHATRLLTLTGSGGVGKTRLSLELARDLLPEFPDGVWFIELAPLADPTLIAQTIAATLGVPEQPNRTVQVLLREYLRPQTTLLVFDNCEHLLTEVSVLVDALLRAAPHLKVLASSREALGIGGEQAWRVPSLEMPTAGAAGQTAELLQYAAARLFVERATFANAAFLLTEANAAAVTEICVRLDGIPLAIELAAARVKAMRVEQIAERIDDRFRLLTGGSRTALPRQQTLRGTIDWSYSLLSEPERVLLRRLAVFAGGWTLQASEAVCADDGRPGTEDGRRSPSDDVLELLTRLVEKSLVVLDEQAAEPRYRLLETVRQYAREKLLDAGEGAAVRERHLAYCISLAEEAEAKLQGPEQVRWLSRLETELDNLRVAMDWSLQRDESSPGLRLAGALWWFWYTHVYYAELIARLREMLSRPVTDWQARARGMIALTLLLSEPQTFEAARVMAAEVLATGQTMADPFFIAWGQFLLASSGAQLDFSESQRLFAESTRGFEAIGYPWHVAMVQLRYGITMLGQIDAATARILFLDCIQRLRSLGDQNMLAAALRWAGRVEVNLGLAGEALPHLAESVRLNVAVGDKRGILASIGGLAYASLMQADLRRAAKLGGAIERLRHEYRAALYPADGGYLAQDMATLRARMDGPTFDAAWNEGRALTLEQAIALALDDRHV